MSVHDIPEESLAEAILKEIGDYKIDRERFKGLQFLLGDYLNPEVQFSDCRIKRIALYILTHKQCTYLQMYHLLLEAFDVLGRMDLCRTMTLALNGQREIDKRENGIHRLRIFVYRTWREMTPEEEVQFPPNLLEFISQKMTSEVLSDFAEIRKLASTICDSSFKSLHWFKNEFGDQSNSLHPLVLTDRAILGSTESVPEPEDAYIRRRSLKSANCVLINNEKFDDETLNRSGSVRDFNRLKETMTKLKIEWGPTFTNLKAKGIEEVCLGVSKRDYEDKDFLIFIILSHGAFRLVNGVDSGTVDIEKIKDYFNSNKCPTLAGKPKLFFIQACQEYPSRTNEELLTERNATESFASHKEDFFTMNSVAEGNQSYRHETHGSIFIQILCDVLEDPSNESDDILTLCTKVNCRVNSHLFNKYGILAVSSFTSTLRKKCSIF